MGWDTEWQLEGLFYFGAPLNIWEHEFYHEPVGYQPLSYYILHMRVDDDQYLIDRLDEKVKNSKFDSFQRLIIMHINTQYPHEYWFYKPWLYSFERNYRPSKYPYDAWKGFTLGIAFEKTSQNEASMARLKSYWY